MAKRNFEEDVLPNLTQQSRLAAAGGKPELVTAAVVKKTVGKIFEVVKHGASQAKDLVSEKIVIQLADVIVIGAGLSGLAFAESLLEKSRTLRVFLFESSSTIGGRIQTEIIHSGSSTFAFDIGGSWISRTKHENVVQACERFRIDLLPQHRTGSQIFIRDGERKSYLGSLPPLSLRSLWELRHRFLANIRSMVSHKTRHKNT